MVAHYQRMNNSTKPGCGLLWETFDNPRQCILLLSVPQPLPTPPDRHLHLRQDQLPHRPTLPTNLNPQNENNLDFSYHLTLYSYPVLFHIHVIEIDQDLNHFPNTSPSRISTQILHPVLQTFDSSSIPCPLKSTNSEKEDLALLVVELITISLLNKANHFGCIDSHQTFH